jgi:hypothetical protein
MHFKCTGCEGLDWIKGLQDRIQWRTVVVTVINLRAALNEMILFYRLSDCRLLTTSFHGVIKLRSCWDSYFSFRWSRCKSGSSISRTSWCWRLIDGRCAHARTLSCTGLTHFNVNITLFSQDLRFTVVRVCLYMDSCCIFRCPNQTLNRNTAICDKDFEHFEPLAAWERQWQLHVELYTWWNKSN